MLLVLAILFGVSLAQRPSDASICDYYAESRYGMNSSATQLRLIKDIVALAFGGGFNLSNVSSDITGILNPGSFQGESVNLQPWFNGTIDSTNLNNQPVGIDWLDDGGPDPLYSYLSGATTDVVLRNSTNQYRLFGQFFFVFSRIFGCSTPPAPLPSSGGPLSLAYVHKFMNLNHTQLGHFIDQLSKASMHFGFSSQDSQTLNTQMNSLYNVRCAPPITFNPAQGPQLLSLCQATTCPLAQPVADCAAYVNLTANGIASGVAPTATPSPSSTFTTTSATSTSSSTTPTTSPNTSSSTAPPAVKLSAGAIAGIAVGAAALLLILVGALIFFLRRRKSRPEPGPQPGPYTATAPIGEFPSNQVQKHTSFASHGPTLAEMESPRHAGSPEMGYRNAVEMAGHEQREQLWGRRV